MKKTCIAIIAFYFLVLNTVLAQAIIDKNLKAALLNNTKPVQVVITFTGNSAPTATNIALLKKVGITKGITFKALPIAGALATATQVNALANSPEVKSIYLNKKLTYFNFNGTNITGVKKLRADKNIISKNKGLPVTGKGITVLVNDSGVDGTHEDLKFGTHLVQNVLGSTNLQAYDTMLPVTYVEGILNTDTNSGHGTHCAGSVGGTGARSGGLYEGVAPGAKLVGYGSGGALFVLDGIGGFDYALTNQQKYGIRVITNSWGSSGDFDPFDPINLASKKAYDRGIVPLFAAGNEGPGSDTHNPYAIAPWVISVGAGDKFGKLAEFSSRGVKGEKGTFTMDGQSWTFENRPTVVAPGVDIISTRTAAPVSSLSADMDAQFLAPTHVPFYTHMSGTSMATPHVAGIVALMLEAKPTLTPAQVKQILQKTATNMPGRESWEVGAGYVNAYAAIDQIFRSAAYGSTLNYTRTFTSSVNSKITTTPISINYNPATATTNQILFTVANGTTGIEAKIVAGGVMGQTGNPVNLILTDPAGKEYRAGIPVAFTLYYDRSVAVASPLAGQWKLRVEGLNGAAIPEKISGNIAQKVLTGTTGLGDIAGHPAEASIRMAVSSRLVDGISGSFKPNEYLKRIQLANYLLMGQGVRQYFPTNSASTYSDLTTTTDKLLAESVTAKGAAIRDREYKFNGVMRPTATGKFSPTANVTRASLAYSLVQSLGLQEFALQRNGKPVTVTVDGKKIPVDDAAKIPAGLEGYVSLALELNLINAYYSVTQGSTDLQPTLHATFKPTNVVTRADFAVIITRTFKQWDAATQPATAARVGNPAEVSLPFTMQSTTVYPNPFVDNATFTFSLPQDDFVTIEVFDTLGKKVKTLVSEKKSAGTYNLTFDGSKLSKGTYLYQVKTGNKVTSARFIKN